MTFQIKEGPMIPDQQLETLLIQTCATFKENAKILDQQFRSIANFQEQAQIIEKNMKAKEAEPILGDSQDQRELFNQQKHDFVQQRNREITILQNESMNKIKTIEKLIDQQAKLATIINTIADKHGFILQYAQKADTTQTSSTDQAKT